MSPAVVTLAPARGPESAASARHAACRSRPPSTDTLRRTRTLDDPVEEGATEVNITRLISETRRLFAPLAAARPRSPAGDRRRHHEFMRCFRSCLRPKDLFRGPVLVPYRAAAAARPALPETPRERPQGRAGGVGTSETVGARAYGPISASCAVYRTKRQRRAASVAAAGLKSLAAHGGSTAGVASLVKSAAHGESTAGLTSPVKSVARGSSTAGQTSPVKSVARGNSTAGQTSPVKSVARGNSTAGVRPARPQTSRQGPGTESTGNVLEEDAGLNCGVSQRGAPRPALCQQREAGSRAGISVTTVTDAETSAGPRPRLDHRNSAVIILKPEPFTQLSPFFLKDLCKMAALLEFPEGKVVFRQGDVGEHCFSVLVIFPVLSSSAERACVLTTAVKRFRPRRLATRDVKLNRPGTSWYVLLSGLVDVFICPEPNNTGTMNKIAQLKAGDGFGELALVNDKVKLRSRLSPLCSRAFPR
ncbi:MAG: hypothetical protein BJ554DRAFT_8252 [Olpidium bornovanus]|uniref:Cyclic nucleotide-binding domain-containing protein n=1 Tax=Olpidium bornovanus TaxID=278681 RepID=A0A8H7ZUL8_9FUNG|nr:MAG: hypothetical protein BJ554DRAFT_8252 [Olpidium bornovanus]